MTKLVQHTAGPWHNTSKNYGYGPCHVCGPKHVDGGDYAPICIANTEANARLIAAAPELLNACKQLVELAEWLGTPPGYSWSDICAPVRLGNDAIAKAEGR